MMRVALLPTCVVDTVAPETGVAVVRVLRRLGMEVSVPQAATCCGQPAWNAGFREEAAAVARTTLRALVADSADVVCVPAGSCATMIKVSWVELFTSVGDRTSAGQALSLGQRVREFSQLVAEHGGPPCSKTRARVAYHHSCHMLRELGLREDPRTVLEAVEDCEIVEWDGDDRCCGFGGLFSVKQPELSVAMADDKLDALARAGADTLIGCDQSCLLHLKARLRRRGIEMPVKHLAEFLDDSHE